MAIQATFAVITNNFQVYKKDEFKALCMEYNFSWGYKIASLYSITADHDLSIKHLEEFTKKLLPLIHDDQEIDLIKHEYFHSKGNMNYRHLLTQHWKISNKYNVQPLKLFNSINILE